jgi:hypothetical protein
MIKKVLLNLILAVSVVLFQSFLLAQTPVQNEKSKRIQFCVSHRLRYVTWDNAITLDKSLDAGRSFTRHRTSLQTRWTPGVSWEFLIKMTNEFRHYFKPNDIDFTIHEFFVDNLYLKWIRPWELPFELTLGRQNIILGEGFVVMDGHPLDGSRSIYFNAARLDYFLKDKNRFTLFYIYQPERDTWLPIINDQEQPLIEEPQEGIGLYYSGEHANALIDLYLIRKMSFSTTHDSLNVETYSMGSRLKMSITKKLSLTGEYAAQIGKFRYIDIFASGGYLYLDYHFRKQGFILKKIRGGLLALSGDDSTTADKIESWDPLFSRWPKWSESYIYTQIQEYGGRIATWSNLNSIYGGLYFQLFKSIELELIYHHLTATQYSEMGIFPGGGGNIRGELFISKCIFRLNPKITGHVLWEVFSPGDFYFSGADGYSWFRVEFMYRI